MPETFYVVPPARHNATVAAAYQKRGYTADEANAATKVAENASRHGIRTHNGIKALHLDDHFGSGAGGCKPGAQIEKKPSRFAAAEIWNANKKLGQAVAVEAVETCIKLADQYGVGQVSVDNAFHYLWGGGYVMDAAKRGYLAYTNCTAALAEVVPFGGRRPTLGTNPHSWGFPTTDALGFPIVVDWATSVVAMGRVQQLLREGKQLPPDAAVDKEGKVTTDPAKVAALLPFGQHKGYGLSLINEIVAAYIGGSLPTLRCRDGGAPGEKHTPCFFFQVVHPEAMSGNAFAAGRSQAANVKAVLKDILSGGNESCLVPGQLEAQAAAKCAKFGGLLFSAAEIAAFDEIAAASNQPRWNLAEFKEAKE
ncbi:MAG TPA: Ldh family oxidoreductase [Opitutales bacterium]|nr:Ldh family oxidoreductase [Opitutales bacterium]